MKGKEIAKAWICFPEPQLNICVASGESPNEPLGSGGALIGLVGVQKRRDAVMAVSHPHGGRGWLVRGPNRCPWPSCKDLTSR